MSSEQMKRTSQVLCSTDSFPLCSSRFEYRSRLAVQLDPADDQRERHFPQLRRFELPTGSQLPHVQSRRLSCEESPVFQNCTGQQSHSVWMTTYQNAARNTPR